VPLETITYTDDIMLLAGIAFYSLISLLVPVLIIVLIIRLIMRHRDGAHQNGPLLKFREVLLSTLVIAAGYCGVVGLYALPIALFGEESEYANQVLVTHLISAIMLLIAGLFIKNVTGKFLMVVGLFLLLMALGPAFQTLGSGGALLAVILAFAVLIVITVHVSRKARTNG
jgi:hypothetical protein